MMLTSRALLLASLAFGASALVVVPPRSIAFLAANASEPGKYGKDKCKCVGIDNLKGWFSMPLGPTHVQYPIEVGASCEAWEQKVQYRYCSGKNPPDWCSSKWCYVDPASCDLEVLPKQTETGMLYKGSPAYWSYDTCGGKDTFSKDMVKHACVNQESEKDCSKQPKCAWDGKQCLGKDLLKTIEAESKLDESVAGHEDCRCVGHSGKNGIAKMFINAKEEIDYSADVGGKCGAWEKDTHPKCKGDGKKPSWCTMKWCWVDPCKCKIKVPAKAVQQANSAFKFQGMTAHWSYATCGSEDTWSSDNEDKYCHTQKSASSCRQLGKCTWTEKEECMTKEAAELCHLKAAQSGEQLPWMKDKSGAHRAASFAALLMPFGYIITA